MPALKSTDFIVEYDGDFLCPVCGYDGTFKGDHFADDEGGCIATGICSCCLFEPGFDDNPAASGEASETIYASVVAYRRRWIADGRPWRGGDVKPKPSNWDASSQLDRLLRLAPHLD